MIDLAKARAFMATHARVLDRRRLELLLDGGEPEPVIAALAAYRNADGGYGWALEPDLRSPSSQPVGALHAFEVLEEIAPATSPLGVELCDWIGSVALPDGGLPFALGGVDGPGDARWWAQADPTTPSLHITAAVCGAAQRAAALDVSPRPGRPLRSLIPSKVIERGLDRLEQRQRDDGGWDFDWITSSPASPLEWRGFLTVNAISVLRANGRLGD